MEVSVDEVFSLIQESGEIEGVTISGGEPFSQPYALKEILAGTRQLGLGSIVFSGFTLQSLKKKAAHSRETQHCLKSIDLLVDGLFHKGKRSLFGMRGSDNQKFHFLSARYLRSKEEIFGYERTQFEILEGRNGAMLVGIPSSSAEEVWDMISGNGSDFE